ncbi:MAG: DUF4389 domain-containing protein [Salibacteraceae bacterium]
MLTLNVQYQKKYSRVELFLRSFLGGIFIVAPHFFILFFVIIWAKLLWVYATFYILLKGEYPSYSRKYLIGVLGWLSRIHLSVYNLVDGYPAFGINAEAKNVTIKYNGPNQINRLSVLFRFLFSGIIILPHLIIWIFRNLISCLLTFLAFWAVIFTGKFPKQWHDFNVATLRWLIRIIGFQLYLEEEYPPFNGKPNE